MTALAAHQTHTAQLAFETLKTKRAIAETLCAFPSEQDSVVLIDVGT